jgi:hypothetical protein
MIMVIVPEWILLAFRLSLSHLALTFAFDYDRTIQLDIQTPSNDIFARPA